MLVSNMVASSTKEGNVLVKLPTKLDIIRDGMGDDLAFDVIQDIVDFRSVGLSRQTHPGPLS